MIYPFKKIMIKRKILQYWGSNKYWEF